MKKDILDRYDRDNDGNLIIKISSTKIEDLYADFDKESSFLKKDLDDSLVEYIIDSVNEIGSENFILRFYFEHEVDIKAKERVTNSIKRFFEYFQELERKKMKEQIKNAFIFMLIGIFFTTIAIIIGKKDINIVQEIFSEGLMVAGWVSLWEALATFLIKWLPLLKKLKLYKKIAVASVKFD